MNSREPVELISSWRTGPRCPRRVNGTTKRRAWRRKVVDVDTILVHATAVKGGLAPGKKRVSMRLAHILDADAGVPTDVELLEAERQALSERYNRQTYHGVYSPRARLSVVQWDAREYTYHGDKANGCSIGWAYDGRFKPGEIDELDVDGGRESLRHIIRDALEQGCPLRRISPHANHSRKLHDPGPLVWLEVVQPVADEFGLELALDWTTKPGQPWARRWMEGAA